MIVKRITSFEVSVSHNNVKVLFISDSSEEIDAIKKGMGYQWKLDDNCKKPNWVVKSTQISSVHDICSVDAFIETSQLYLDVKATKKIIDNKHYFLHKLNGVRCITCFDLNSNTTTFYHEKNISDYSYIRNLIREPVMAMYKNEDAVVMHASACSVGDKGVIIPGAKSSGKSTLLCHLLSNGAKYIGNDGVLCKKNNNEIRMSSVPQCIRLSEETIKNNKHFNDFSIKNFDNMNLVRDKYEFLPYQLDEIFDHKPFQLNSNLVLIIIPEIDLKRKDYTIKISNIEKHKNFLEESIFGLYHNYKCSPHFSGLNDYSLDIVNLNKLLSMKPLICQISYGILDICKQEELYKEIVQLIN